MLLPSSWRRRGSTPVAVNARFIKPLDEAMLDAIASRCSLIVTAEEGTVVNGFGAWLAAYMQRVHPHVRVLTCGVADELVMQAPRADQLAHFGLTPAHLAATVRTALNNAPVR